jgi:tetratricopeptide (TPR) repeat protein
MSAGSCARIAISVLVLVVAAAGAAPRYTRTPSSSTAPEVVAAEQLWSAAAAETNVRAATDAWDKAAASFLAIVDAGKLPAPVQKECAYAAMLAVKNAMSVDPRVRSTDADKASWDRAPAPKPIPEREQRFIRIAEAYWKLDASSDDAVDMRFLHANILRRYEHLDEAITILRDILDHHRDHEVAEYSANLALDSYNRLQRHDELVALADALRTDAAFMAKFPDTAELVRKIHVQSQSMRAGHCSEAARKAGDRAAHDRCGELYLASAAEAGAQGDEALYNAFVSFQEAGSLSRALDVAAQLDQQFPRSRLRPHAAGRKVVLLAGVGRFAEAAAATERLLAAFPAERNVLDLGEDAVRWRVMLGELDRAERDLAIVERNSPFGRRPRTAALRLVVVGAHLAADQRAAARRLVQPLDAVAFASLATDETLASVRVLLDVACPVALVDGLCLRRRDPLPMRIAGSMLVRLAGTHDAGNLAAHIMADLELEQVLAHRRAARPERASEAYRAELRSTTPELRIAAHARLAQLALDARHIDEARAELDACVRDGRAMPAAEGWVRICDRLRVAAKLPPLDPVPELLPQPTYTWLPQVGESTRQL